MSNEPDRVAERAASNATRFELLSASGDSCVLDAEGHCITCSDEALPARVLHIDEQLGTALVAVEDQTEEVDITLVEEVVPGSWLLVHGGVAIATLAEGEAGAGEDAMVGEDKDTMVGEDAINRVPTNEANDG
jgi:hydrogenase assembly chaperone HypC/HupF